MSTVFGLVLLLSAVLVGRSAVLVKRSAARDVPAELEREMSQARNSVLNQVRAAEADYLQSVRVLQAELDTRRALLDRLIEEADGRIETLEDRIDAAATVPFRRAA